MRTARERVEQRNAEVEGYRTALQEVQQILESEGPERCEGTSCIVCKALNRIAGVLEKRAIETGAGS